MSAQDQFLNVIDRDEAEARFRAALNLKPLGIERIPLSDALGRVLARDVVARVDVPSFDRSNFDGFAVRAAVTFGASELEPRTVKLLPQSIDSVTMIRGGLQSTRRTQTYSDYRRFVTAGRILKDRD